MYPRKKVRLFFFFLVILLPQIIARIFCSPLVQGYPAFLVAALTGALGLHLPGRAPQK